MLEVLSENRDLKDYIKEAEAMLTQVDVEKLPSYELGLEQGLERGMEQGMEQGMERGAYRERLRLAKSLLDLLPEEVIAEKSGLSLEAIRALRPAKD